MRRKSGGLVPLEALILEAALGLRHKGQIEFHGYALATRIAETKAARKLTAYGTLYRALGRLEKLGALESRWEDPFKAEAEGRPRRRLYSMTPEGERTLQRARMAARDDVVQRHPVLRSWGTPTFTHL